MATIIIDDDVTERRPVIKAVPPSAAKSDFYIVARDFSDDNIITIAVYPLITVPFDVFLAWLDDILEEKRRQSLVLSVVLRNLDVWQSLKFLDDAGIGMSKHLFTSYDAAARALEDMKAKKFAESEGRQ